MMTRSAFMVLLGLVCLLVGCNDGRAQDAPWTDWPAERDGQTSGAIYSPDLTADDAPRVKTILAEDAGASGDSYEDLRAALSMLSLDVSEVEAVDVSQDDRLVVWGTAETEHGERRFAARLAPSGDGPQVTVFIATEADFEAMGGPAFVGGDPDAGQSLASAEANGAAALQPSAMQQVNEQPEEGASGGGSSVPIPVSEEGSDQIPGWTWDDEGGFAARPGDPASPRLQFLLFDVGEVDSPAEAAAHAVEKIGLRKASYPAPRLIPSHVQLAGNAAHVTFGTARNGGAKQRFALFITQNGETGRFNTGLLHAPPATYRAWDGVIAPLLTFGVLSDPSMFDAALRKEVREASDEEQIEVFVQVFEIRITMLAQQMMTTAMMMTHQSTMDMLQQMGSNIATETTCIMTSGCSVSYDGSGNAQMSPTP